MKKLLVFLFFWPFFLIGRQVVVTACNDVYFDKCLTLIASVHRTSFDDVDEIIVYDLGLNQVQVNRLKQMAKVTYRTFEEIKGHFPTMDLNFFYTKTKSFGWKQVCVHDAARENGDLIFWLDSGAALLKPVQEIFDWIEKDDIFLVVDEWHNYTWTHQQCARIMEASLQELEDFQLCAGIQGYKKGGRYQKMMDEALCFSLIKECIDGYQFYSYGFHPVGDAIRGHRHDQSILSILASRYRAPKQDIRRYGEWRSFAYCQYHDSVIWVHRGQYQNHEGIVYK